MTKHTHAFQAEVAQLLHLVTHSLYSNKEIFLRELISNASDACDKLRYESLNNAALLEDTPTLEIRVAFDKAAKTLTISDNGIGMSQQEAIEHLGTIAKSGTRDFMSKLSGDQQSDAKDQGSLIGQFGVGFYSGFIVADKIVVETRRAGLAASEGVRWTSGGSGDFEVETITQDKRGSHIILHLRDDAEEFLSNWKIKSIIGKYADHIALPILMRKEEWKEGENEQPGEMVVTDEWETVNKASALWTRPKKDISAEQHAEFYKAISHDFEPPLAWSHNKVEGSTEYTQLLYLPGKAPFDLWNRDKKGGIKLYVKRVFIMDDAEALLPTYLRFVKGVVDSADLPLNVSRELLQESRDVKAIREGNTRRVLSMLDDLAKHDAPAADASDDDKQNAGKFTKFYADFGAVLKEGLGEDFANKDKIAKLLRFASSTTDTVSVGFADYKARMKEAAEESAETFKPLLAKLKEALKDKADDVRITSRLVDSPACLVVKDDAMSLQLARMLKQAGQTAPESKPILEINPEHPLVKKLDTPDGQIHFHDLAHIVFDQALLAEGGLPADPAAYVKRVNALLV